ncbi:MAG: DNA gyrase subunit A, partial [Candidatus Brennerbacteria bacterium]|nr:DNA gyrase subunit A [Candidatus Brennerbacteria bacterium]
IIHNFLDIPPVETISAIITYDSQWSNADGQMHLMMVTKNGLVKKVDLSSFEKVRRTGILAIKLKKNDSLKSVKLTSKGEEAIITSGKGQAIRFKESDIRSQGRNASGVRGIRLKASDTVSSLDIIKGGKGSAGLRLLTVMSKGFAKQSELGLYKLQSRGGQGIKTAKVTDKTGEVIATHVIKDQEEILALSGKGQVLRTKISGIRLASRATQGVRIINLKAGDKLVGVITL